MDPALLAALLAAFGIIATLIVAVTTLTVARRTKDLAQATVDLGTHAARQVEEMETSRKLEWQPYLTHQPNPGDDLASGIRRYTAAVTNIGRGPAINCLLVRFLVHEWGQSSLFDLGHGQDHDAWAPFQDSAIPTFLGDKPGITTVLFCQDQFGACHMFKPPGAPAVSSSEADTAPWAVWYREAIAIK